MLLPTIVGSFLLGGRGSVYQKPLVALVRVLASSGPAQSQLAMGCSRTVLQLVFRIMQIAILLSLVATLLAAQTTERVRDPSILLLHMLGVLSVMAMVVVVAIVRTQLLIGDLRRQLVPPELLLEQFNRSHERQVWLWFVASLLILWPLNWPAVCRTVCSSERLHLWDYLILVTPQFIPLCLSWASLHDVDQWFQKGPGGLTRRQFVASHIRHLILPAGVPFVIVLAMHDLGGLWPASWQSPWLALVGNLSLLSGCVVIFPALMNYVWETDSLPAGRLRDDLEHAMRCGGINVRDVRAWASGKRLANAVVMGVCSRWRYVLLSDGLLESLNPRQVVAVFAHELAHVRQRHLTRLMCVTLSLVAGVYLVANLLELDVIDKIDWQGQVRYLLALRIAAMAMSVAIVIKVLSCYSHALEHDADFDACTQLARISLNELRNANLKHVGNGSIDPMSGHFLDAVTELILALQALVPAAERQRPSILHPSVEARVALLKRSANGYVTEFQIRRRARYWEATVAIVVASLAVVKWGYGA